MTYKEFKRSVFVIFSETYGGEDVSPIEYGIQRAIFEEKKLLRLIALADHTDLSTARRKMAGWRRQLERVRQIRLRLELRRIDAPIVPANPKPMKRPERMSVSNARQAQPLRLQ